MAPEERTCAGPLDDIASALAVVAHPDDESFGLGAILDRLTAQGAKVAVLCFTHGEASTLRPGTGDLAAVRTAELAAASDMLGIGPVELLNYPDGRLEQPPASELAGHVRELASNLGASHLLAFDTGGVTGHPDHVHATRAALIAGAELGLPVLGWTLPQRVADTLNAEFGTAFTGRDIDELGPPLTVDRARQRRAIACHTSQATGNPVLYRRLELQGPIEHVRPLRPSKTITQGEPS